MIERSSSLRYCGILLFLALAFSLPCSAQPTSTRPINVGIGTSWVFADFDGDHQLDMASVRHVVGDDEGSPAQIDVSLKLASQHKLAVPDFDNPGIEIAALDLDGDNDLDIVVSRRHIQSQLKSSRLGVWINDGHGSFTEKAASGFPARDDAPTFKAADPEPSGQDFDFQPIQPWLELVESVACKPPTPTAVGILSLAFVDRLFLAEFGPHLLRAPPASSTI